MFGDPDVLVISWSLHTSIKLSSNNSYKLVILFPQLVAHPPLPPAHLLSVVSIFSYSGVPSRPSLVGVFFV